MIAKSKIFEVYEERGRLYTANLTPGKRVYDEQLVKQNNIEYREWDAYGSKLASTILNGCRNIFIRKNDVILYLGSASGTTVSHVSDIVGKEGLVFAVDVAPRVMRDLIFNLEGRKNVAHK
jgi:fibrillarin-like pre-rRNA processing protein